MIPVFPTPVGSLHDRVCQMFYEIKGGRVDYGEEHSAFHGHDRFGLTCEGKYPQWDADHPIYIVGHSFGGITAWTLQNYLAQQRFPGHSTSDQWVKGIVAVNSPFNGALQAYGWGLHLTHPALVQWGSKGFLVGVAVHVSEYIGWMPMFNFGEAHWSLHWRNRGALMKLLAAMFGAGIHINADNIAFDASVQSQLLWQRCMIASPRTQYLSIMGNIHLESSAWMGSSKHRLDNKQAFISWVLRTYYSLVDRALPDEIGGVATAHWANEGTDGLISSYSQKYPRLVDQTSMHGQHVDYLEQLSSLPAGQWHFTETGITHVTASFACRNTWSLIWDVLHCMAERQVSCSSESTQAYQQALARQKRVWQETQPDFQRPYIPLHCHACDPFPLPRQSTWFVWVRMFFEASTLWLALPFFHGCATACVALTTACTALVMQSEYALLATFSIARVIVVGLWDTKALGAVNFALTVAQSLLMYLHGYVRVDQVVLSNALLSALLLQLEGVAYPVRVAMSAVNAMSGLACTLMASLPLSDWLSKFSVLLSCAVLVAVGWIGVLVVVMGYLADVPLLVRCVVAWVVCIDLEMVFQPISTSLQFAYLRDRYLTLAR